MNILAESCMRINVKVQIEKVFLLIQCGTGSAQQHKVGGIFVMDSRQMASPVCAGCNTGT